LSEDPAGTIDGPNTFEYTGNKPLRQIDPWGLATCQPSAQMKNCLEQILEKPIDGVQIEMKPPKKNRIADTSRNKINIYEPCDDFWAQPEIVLEEYYHVLEQWNTGRLSKLKYALASIRGYNRNKYEREAKGWAREHVKALIDCLANREGPVFN
jgi:uncharacterized protein RhaS with RHS repeats